MINSSKDFPKNYFDIFYKFPNVVCKRNKEIFFNIGKNTSSRSLDREPLFNF